MNTVMKYYSSFKLLVMKIILLRICCTLLKKKFNKPHQRISHNIHYYYYYFTVYFFIIVQYIFSRPLVLLSSTFSTVVIAIDFEQRYIESIYCRILMNFGLGLANSIDNAPLVYRNPWVHTRQASLTSIFHKNTFFLDLFRVFLRFKPF